jgi:flagellar basal-body rod protein FlgG
MIRALYSAASGMRAQQMNLDVIANNLANVNTTGFKKSKVEFQDLLYQNTRLAGANLGQGTQLPTSVEVGHGSRPISTNRIFSDGELTQTGERMDFAIAGDGFFEVQMPDGSRAYTRDGAFKIGADGRVITAEGLPVTGFPNVAPGTTSVTVSADGQVTLTTVNGNQNERLQLSRFANPGGLQALGRNLYRETLASGPPEVGQPNENGFGQIQQTFLELSNVKVVEEMVNLITAQRAYEVNTKAITAADEMMQQSNNLHR